MYQAMTYQPKTASPTSFGLVVLLHGAAIAALVLAKMEIPPPEKFPTTEVTLVRVPPPPPEEVVVEPKTELPMPQVRHFEPIVTPPPRPPEDQVQSTETDRSFVDTGFSRQAEPAREAEPPAPPPPAPVRKAARLLSGDLEPPYPSSERIAGNEGSVTVRLAIGANGRVIRAEKVRATSDAFFKATQSYAVRNWRFKPATLDGRPVESSTVMTVHFKLDGEDA